MKDRAGNNLILRCLNTANDELDELLISGLLHRHCRSVLTHGGLSSFRRFLKASNSEAPRCSSLELLNVPKFLASRYSCLGSKLLRTAKLKRAHACEQPVQLPAVSFFIFLTNLKHFHAVPGNFQDVSVLRTRRLCSSWYCEI